MEDIVEQNDNSFDGIINNLPDPGPGEILRRMSWDAEAAEKKAERDSVLGALNEQREKILFHESDKPAARCRGFREPEERERV